MALRRTRDVRTPVCIRVDGKEVVADEGEPLTLAIQASGRDVLARSVKYHRPRGPACYAGRCDGCLMRVDGVPNVMTCRVPATDGMVVETQNVLGSAEADLLAVTDWFFPKGMDHHHMFTAFGPLNRVMQKIARRIAGIGRLPEAVASAVAPTDLRADVVVVGGGVAGLTVAREVAATGACVRLFEEEQSLGGVRGLEARAYAESETESESAQRFDADVGATLEDEAEEAGAIIHRRTPVVAILDGVVVAHAEQGLIRVETGAIVLATGTHEGAVPVEGSDLPGVVGWRAALSLLACGAVPGERVVLLHDDDHATSSLAARYVAAGVEVVHRGSPAGLRRVEGGHAAERVVVEDERGERTVPCDAVVLAAKPSGAFELGGQSGADVAWRDDGFWIVADPKNGATRTPGVWAVGAATGVVDPEAIESQAEACARAVEAHRVG
ncbi:MAG: 2Fe-2S iron-sulfur cluster-binding protein [Polyangiales bacterium]|nr:(2Fe-2S)-binding protein [Myxococcales bacterium]